MKRMRKAKHKWANRVLSFIMALAMIVTMAPTLPGGKIEAKAAGTETNVTIHFMVPNAWGWGQPAIQYWGGMATVSGDTNGGVGTDIPNWGGAQAYFFTQGADDGTNTEYTITEGHKFSVIDFSITSNTINPAYDAKLTSTKRIPNRCILHSEGRSMGILYRYDRNDTTPIYQRQSNLPVNRRKSRQENFREFLNGMQDLHQTSGGNHLYT